MRRFGRSVRWFFAAGLLGALLGLAETAQASCGDYVKIGRSSWQHADTLSEIRAQLALEFARSKHLPVQSRGDRFPCSGPMCSSGTPSPFPPTPPSNVNSNSIEWACLAATGPRPALESAGSVRAVDLRLSDGHSKPPEHPPKVS